MASGRIRIGHGSPSVRSMSAEYGQYNLLGQDATLTVPASEGVSIESGAVILTKSSGGLGSKPSSVPFFWNTFTEHNGVANGDLLIGYADQRSHGSNEGNRSSVTVDTSAGRGSNVGALKLHMPFTYEGAETEDFFPHIGLYQSNQGLGNLSSDTLYMAYWMKMVRVSGGNTANAQIKGPRTGTIVGSTSSDWYGTGLPRYTPSLYVSGSGSWEELYQEVWDGSPDGAEHFNFDTPVWNTGGWNFVEAYMTYNTPGVANGVMRFWINGTDMLPGFPDSENSDAIRVRESGDESKLFNFVFLTPGVDIRSFSATSTYQLLFSEHYVDTTSRRVVMTNSATYSSSTSWAVQPVSSWSDIQVVIEDPNMTGFSSGSTGHFHVFTGPTTSVYIGSAVLP